MSAQLSVTSALRVLLPLVSAKERRRFVGLLALSVIMALVELALTGLVALLAAIFGSPEAVLHNNPIRWIRNHLGVSFGDDPRFLALAALGAVVAAIIVKNALVIVQQWQVSTFSESVGVAGRARILRFYQRAPYLWIARTGVADMNFGMNAASRLPFLLLAALQFFANSLLLCGLFAGLISVAPLPSLAFMTLLGLGGWLAVTSSRRRLNRAAEAVYTAEYAITKMAHLILHGMKEIRLSARENALFSGFVTRLEQTAAARKRQWTIARLPVAGLETLGFVALILVLLFLIFVQEAGMARISGIMGFMAAAAWRGLPVANRLVGELAALRSDLPYLGKVIELMNTENAVADQLLLVPETPPAPLPFTRSIRLEELSFRYAPKAAPVLSDVSLEITKGSLFGLVGLSGAGKSTLVNLLTGLMPPDSGRLLVDGTPITRENAASWLQRIGYVAQSPYILDATLAENVALSRWGETIDKGRVLTCCRMAALDFIDELEQGIDTVLGDRGVRLSGGQAQRVAIARALYAEPDVVIFDEATSSLDMKNEKAILDTILSLRNQVSMIIIAHRLSTVASCDRIAWLDKGRMRCVGHADEVLPEYTAALRHAAPETEAWNRDCRSQCIEKICDFSQD